MGDMIKIGGKSPSNTLVGIRADDDGHILESRYWETPLITVFNETISDTNNHVAANVDVSAYPILSLRITNRTGATVRMTPLVDLFNTDNGYSITDENAGEMYIDLPATSSYIMITPNEAPWLNYIKYLRLKFNALDTANGKLEVYAVCKR